MSRRDHDDIHIRESENGPEVVFVSGQSSWVINCTEADPGRPGATAHYAAKDALRCRGAQPARA